MPLFSSQQPSDSSAQADIATLMEWRATLAPAIDTLRRMAGTTEDEFLQIGSEVQGFYQRSAEISRMSGELVQIVSGDSGRSLTSRLQQMMTDMEEYLANARTRSGDSCKTLEEVKGLLEKLSAPLEGFQKMNKTLRMLSISTKIESSRLGELGSGFVNLAMDVEKLSHQVNDKSAAILAHRQLLSNMIVSNLSAVRTGEAAQDRQVTASLNSTAASLQELVSVNERCTAFGSVVSSISAEVTGNISEVVSSMQMHDMTRQQVEHIVEALEGLLADLPGSENSSLDQARWHALIVEAGDVCELQEAQLRFASSELYSAVGTIVENLRDIANKQMMMEQESGNVTGVADSADTSFVDVMSQGMQSIAAVLASCARSDSDMADTIGKVAQTIAEIASFVTDIEEIGTEIDLIALNAQIKAAHTGPDGAALGVLAEAIKRLSDEAVRQTNAVAAILTGINSATEHLSGDSGSESRQLAERMTFMREELDMILQSLGSMNSELFAVLSGLSGRVSSLTEDVERATSRIDVHEQTKEMAAAVLASLEQIVREARRIEPASSEFKQNLLHMEKHYTMESERHIHEALARKRSGLSAVAAPVAVSSGSSDDSEFGDNVDLF